MAIPTAICDATALEQLDALERRDISAMELLDAHLARIEAVNPTINGVVALAPEVGRARAEAVDATRAAGGDPGPLGGLVMAHKDLTDTAGIPTTMGSAIFRDRVPTRDSYLVETLRNAGAVCLGKTNTPEFGAGSHTFNEVYGTTVNAWDTGRTVGGSSGGAGVALACGMVSLADGSDQGGSLRNPAAWNGVVGLRPTAGVVPRVDGLRWQGNTTEGPMARTVGDLALLFSVLAHRQPRDPLNIELSHDLPLTPDRSRRRVAYSPTLGGLPIESAVADTLATFVGRLADDGWEITEADPRLDDADRIFEVIRAWRWGPQAAVLGDRAQRLKQTIRTEIARGLDLTGVEVSEAFMAAGALRDRTVAFFDDYDVLIAPVTQVEPFPIETEYPTVVAGREMGSYVEWMRVCSRVSAMGTPALSLPIGLSPAGLPVGAQVVARPGDDIGLLRIAAAMEEIVTSSSIDWPRRPPILD